MGLLQKDVQRVKTGVLPLHAGAQVAPREQLAFVKCISEGPHLRKHRVQPKPAQFSSICTHPARKASAEEKSIAAHSR